MRSGPCFEPDPFTGVPGPSLAGKRPKSDQHFNLDFGFLLRPLVSIGTAFRSVPIIGAGRGDCGTIGGDPEVRKPIPPARPKRIKKRPGTLLGT